MPIALPCLTRPPSRDNSDLVGLPPTLRLRHAENRGKKPRGDVKHFLTKMNLRAFVSGSAVILVGWLALSFFHRPKSQHYPSSSVSTASSDGHAKKKTGEVLASVDSSSP